MSILESSGGAMHDTDAGKRREAARELGSARTEKKAEAARQNAALRRGKPLSDEHKEKLRQAQAARREREKALADSDVTAVVEKRPTGRPRTRPIAETTEKRPVGRPRKAKEQPEE